jgi:DNA-binding CsgD family transcriptional regulator
MLDPVERSRRRVAAAQGSTKIARNARIVALHAQGMSPTAIGKRYGISPDRVGEIVRRARQQKAIGIA